ncbi:hypothetical protein [Streptomyces sp. CBMA123]|uniref:hypothetical protein n=1 Tax=Streptomyces sp. CBMA123 TaxID=1896313 RepID=UPI00166194E0|nr:hypothetical protein [Streptomyces sp. CBMA123]MBD0695842.1 hypothetical protein [Streptomyces sp. CBMA123]
MATKTSTLVRAAVAVCAVAAGGFAWAGLDTGAQASAAAPASTPVPSASAAAPSAPAASSTPVTTPADSPVGATGQGPQTPTSQPTAAGTAAAARPAPPAPGAAATSKQADRAPAAAPAPLPPAQLPDNAAAAWKPIAQPKTQATAHDVRLNECAAVKGATTWQQQGYVSSFKTPAIQDTFTFTDAATAQQAYTDLLSAMNTCQQQSRALQSAAKLPQDAQVATTATTAEGTAYSRQWTAVAGMSAPGPQTGHIYLVRHQNVLTSLQFAVPADIPGAGALTAADDQTALSNLATQLSTAPAAAEQRP